MEDFSYLLIKNPQDWTAKNNKYKTPYGIYYKGELMFIVPNERAYKYLLDVFRVG
jgi:hypothetical protein